MRSPEYCSPASTPWTAQLVWLLYMQSAHTGAQSRTIGSGKSRGPTMSHVIAKPLVVKQQWAPARRRSCVMLLSDSRMWLESSARVATNQFWQPKFHQNNISQVIEGLQSLQHSIGNTGGRVTPWRQAPRHLRCCQLAKFRSVNPL